MSRFIGILLISLIFLASGAHKLSDPKGTVAMIKQSNFPKFLKIAQIQVTITDEQYLYIAQATGGAMVTFASFNVLGVARAFSSWMLIFMIIGITACMHLNIEKIEKTSIADQIHVLKNLAMIGGLMVVASLKAPKSNNGNVAAASKKKNQ